MKLYDILNGYPVIQVKGSLKKRIKAVNHDSRKVSKDNLFVALKGFTSDGHDFINQSIKNGAVAVLGEKELDLAGDVTMIRVKDSLDALGYIANNFYNQPWEKLNMVGITGTNGKTSVSYYIKTILDEYLVKTGILGTIGAVFNSQSIELPNTTPDSLYTQKLINKMLGKDIDYCIMEVSSHSLDLKRVDYIDFDIGIFTNLSQDHLDFHGSMEEYFKSKLKLFQKTRRYNIINIDDQYGRKIKAYTEDKIPYITYGLKEKAMVSGSNIVYSDKGIDFTLNLPRESIDIKMNIPGEFSLYNALAAAACSYGFNIDIKTIKKGLEKFQGVKGRLEFIANDLGMNIIIDFAHTPEGLEAILKTIKEFTKGDIYLVFGAGGNRDQEKRPKMGQVAGKYASMSIVTNDNPRFENPKDIIKDIVKGIKETRGKYVEIVDRKEAIEYAILKAKPKDTILLAGKGHERNMIIGKDSFIFDEREIVSNIIERI